MENMEELEESYPDGTPEPETGESSAEPETPPAETPPETGTENSDAGTDEPDAGTDKTDGTDETDAGMDEADAGTDEADAGTDETDAGTDETDAGTDEADAGTDGQTQEPVEPETGSYITVSGNTAVFPDGYDTAALPAAYSSADSDALVQAAAEQTDILRGGFLAVSLFVGVLLGAVLVNGFRLRRV